MVLGKAKVMSYEDLDEARAKRAATEKARAGKGKRGHKRKRPDAEAEAAAEAEAEAEVEAPAALLEAVTDTSASKYEKDRIQPIRPTNTGTPWRAPVVRMY